MLLRCQTWLAIVEIIRYMASFLSFQTRVFEMYEVIFFPLLNSAAPHWKFWLPGGVWYGPGSVKATDQKVHCWCAFESLYVLAAILSQTRLAQIQTDGRSCNAQQLLCILPIKVSSTPSPQQTFIFAESHLSDGVQQPAVGVDDDAKRQDEAEGEQANNVGDIVRRLGPPVDWTGGARSLGPIFAPAHQWRNSPGHGVEPGEADPSQRWAEVSAVGYGGRHHGAVPLVGQNRQGYKGDDAWRRTEQVVRGHVNQTERWDTEGDRQARVSVSISRSTFYKRLQEQQRQDVEDTDTRSASMKICW